VVGQTDVTATPHTIVTSCSEHVDATEQNTTPVSDDDGSEERLQLPPGFNRARRKQVPQHDNSISFMIRAEVLTLISTLILFTTFMKHQF